MKTIIPNIQVKAISSWLPENSIDLQTLSQKYGENDILSIIKTTGIEHVRIVSQEMTSSDMCQKAAEHLISSEGIDKNDIDGLVFVSQTPDYILPATSVCLQDRLGLNKDVVCQDIRYGCSGYVYGLFQAACWIAVGACENVLVLAGDTNSKMINEHDKALKMVMSDAGTATLVTKGDSPMGFHIQSDGSGAKRLIVPAGGFRTPRSSETSILQWDEDKNGRTAEDLYMDGMAIFMFSITKVHKNINTLLESVGWDKEDLDLVALHQANKLMVETIGKKLKVPAEKVPTNVKYYGNTGPASIPLLLSDYCSSHSKTLKRVVLSGFGVGLSLGSVTCDLSNTVFYEPINR